MKRFSYTDAANQQVDITYCKTPEGEYLLGIDTSDGKVSEFCTISLGDENWKDFGIDMLINYLTKLKGEK